MNNEGLTTRLLQILIPCGFADAEQTHKEFLRMEEKFSRPHNTLTTDMLLVQSFHRKY